VRIIIMKYRFTLSAAVFISLVGPILVQAQEARLESTGTGTITVDGKTANAIFELWGNEGRTALIKIDAPGIEVRYSQIAMTGYGSDGSSATGQFTPCIDGGVCRCDLGVEDGAGTALTGVCTNTTKPGALSISISNIRQK